MTDRNQQVARIDYEDDADVRGRRRARSSSQRIEDARRRRRTSLLVSDYLKGAITRRVMDALVAAGKSPRRAACSSIPKIPHLDCYAGATLVTPNHHEAEAATHRRIRTDDDARARPRAPSANGAGCEAVLITRGEHGMWLSSADAEGDLPAAAREVSDVTGAGDTVVATLALALAAGARSPRPPCSPTTPPASSSASSGRRRSRATSCSAIRIGISIGESTCHSSRLKHLQAESDSDAL